ncbi:PAS domain S-box-containing protein [Methanomicrobium sp. W14]|uniref:response regulator n=1 Tax=Methanomicrobium sp. W14 TaxID=2817839 RepID=UPI001AE34DD3|nr:response regulator [Methanomicrobium sp. W14]MBP2134308.1 PAS domain S-box-containing protein [Methanomicrobium sp. W14]
MVDEEPEILEIASIYLKKYNDYSIEKAYSATEALSKLCNNTYDAIVSDYEMPEMNGLDFLRKVRDLNPFIPFIIFSGKGREQVVHEAFMYGADGYVQKGKNPASQFIELNHQIDIAFKKRNAECELKMKEHALEVSFNGIFLLDEKGFITYINNAALLLHKYKSKDEIIGEELSMLFDPINSCHNRIIPGLSETGQYFGEVKGLKSDGNKFDAQLSIIKIYNKMSKESYYFGSYVDITEKKEAEKALMEFLTEAARRLKEPVNHICRNLSEAINDIENGKDPEIIKMKLSVQLKNSQQVIENLKELNKAISRGFDYIPDECRDFLTR